MGIRDNQIHSVRFFPKWDINDPRQVTGLIQLCLDLVKLGTDLEGVEIGSLYGESTNIFLSFPHIKKLTCVDLTIQSRFTKRLANWIADKRVHPLEMGSATAADLFEDSSLDFVYIDADHSYAAVKSDLEAWYPKLKPNGILSGHDYGSAFKDDVIKAVDEFLKLHNLQLKQYPDSSWAAIKAQ